MTQLRQFNSSYNFEGMGLSIENIVSDELKTVKEIQEKFPSLKGVPIINDEADPLKGWWRDEAWRWE